MVALVLSVLSGRAIADPTGQVPSQLTHPSGYPATTQWARSYHPEGVITSVRGWRRDPFRKKKGWEFHDGWDISMPVGTPVRPAADGVVSFSGRYAGYGEMVAVEHGDGYVTLYGHMAARRVREGDAVSTATVIGVSGSTGRSTGPHLHYSIRRWGGNLEIPDRVAPKQEYVAARVNRQPSKAEPPREEWFGEIGGSR